MGLGGGAYLVKRCKLTTTSTRPPPASPSAPPPSAPAVPRPTAYGPVVTAVVKSALSVSPHALGVPTLPSQYGKSLQVQLGLQEHLWRVVSPMPVGYEKAAAAWNRVGLGLRAAASGFQGLRAEG